MSIENNPFSKAGLVLDKERVLTYSKLLCPLDCKYCFVEDLASAEQQKGVAYLTNEQKELLQNLPKDISLIMLGCDTEFFQNREDALLTLEQLATYQKDISVITKLVLPDAYLDRLEAIAKKLKAQGNIFTFSVSIPCFASSKLWEPLVPSPSKRIEMLKKISNHGINSFVAMRPLLPTISNEELASIIESTKDFAIGYYSGPLYLKELDSALIPINIQPELNIEHLQPHWMPEGNLFYKIERPGQMEFLKATILKNGRVLFDGAADANAYLKQL